MSVGATTVVPRDGQMTPLSPDGFRSLTDVSCETLVRLEAYAELLRKWQRKINLVGHRSLQDLWRRHFLDSAQIFDLAPADASRWLDLGSGAGFPGLVIAILGVADMHLAESDSRKCAFLREAARVTETRVTIHNCRIEALPPLAADVITARALAPMSRLLDLTLPQAERKTVALFLKGKTANAELQHIADRLTEDTKYRSMSLDKIPSRTDPDGLILRVKGLIP